MKTKATVCVVLVSLLGTGCSGRKADLPAAGAPSGGGRGEAPGAGPVKGKSGTTTSADLKKASERAERLRREVDKIEFDLAFHGAEPGCLYHLALWVRPLRKRSSPSPTEPTLRITNTQAEAIVDWLQAEGFLASARDLIVKHAGRVMCIDIGPPRGPAVSLGIRGPKHLELSDILARSPGELECLGRLEKALGAEAGKAVGTFAQWARREWSEEEAKRDEAIAALVARLSDKDASERRTAARKLGDFGPSAGAAVPALILALQDEDAEMRLAAAVTLSQLGRAAREAVPALARASQDKNARVRSWAAIAVSRIKEALDDEGRHVRDAAAEAPRKIPAEKRSPDAIELDGVTQDQRRSILELIERRFGAEMTGKVTSISYHAKNKRFNVHIEQRISKRERELLGPRYLVVDPGITSVGWGPRD